MEFKQKTCLLYKSSSLEHAIKVTQYYLDTASSRRFLMNGRLFDFNLNVQEGIPVISSKASSGDSPRALLQEPTCLHHAFSSIKGHSYAPLINRQQTNESLWVGTMSSRTTECFYPLLKKLTLYAPYELVYCVQMMLRRRVDLIYRLQRRQYTLVRQANSMLSWVKSNLSVSILVVNTLIFMFQKLQRTESLELSLESIANFSSQKRVSLLFLIFYAILLLRLASQDQWKIDLMIWACYPSGRSFTTPQLDLSLRSGSSKSLEMMLGSEQDQFPIYCNLYTFIEVQISSKFQSIKIALLVGRKGRINSKVYVLLSKFFHYKQIMEYYKTYCSAHPYEAVTNFCADTDCLVGLCATCICQHTQQHMKRGTPPQYENIKNTFVKYCERMREQIECIEHDKEWLNAVSKSIEEKRQNLREVLIQAREQTVAAVHGYFDQLEGSIQNQIASDAKKNGLHATYRLQTLNTLLSKQISNLLLYSKDLSSQKFLDTVRQVDRQVLPGSSEFHAKISKQLKENEVYTASAIFREDLLSDVTFSLKRLVNLEFILPQMSTYLEQAEKSKRASSAKKTNSSLLVRTTQPMNDFTKVRNVSALLSPTKNISVMMPTPPIQQILAMSGLYNRNQAGTPTMMSKGSRLSSGLKIIRQSRRQNVPNDQVQSFTSSCVSHNKQNDLAHSTYCDTGSNFFR